MSHAIKLPHHSDSAELKTVAIPAVNKVIISMAQHIGAPCNLTVKTGDFVKIGQVIGDSEAFVSAPIHASIAGKVTNIINVTAPNGKTASAVVIEKDKTIAPSETSTVEISLQAIENKVKNNTLSGLYDENVVPQKINNRDEFIKAVRKSGAVGLGGAGFPTHVKLGFDPSRNKVDTLVVNGAECEPYITADSAEMSENPKGIVDGIKLILKYLNIPRAIIGIESDKTEAIFNLNKELSNTKNISVTPLPPLYPQGAEKVLVKNITGRTIIEGELPVSVGVVVINVSTVAFLERYFRTGVPLIEKRISVDGNVVNKPQNYIVPVGTQISEIKKAANLNREPDRILLGGPMMGTCIYDTNAPIGKTTNAVLFFHNQPKKDGSRKQFSASACIRCGRCIRACSMHLMPTELEKAYLLKDVERLKELHLMNCMECGACSYVCPAKRSLAETNSIAKSLLRN